MDIVLTSLSMENREAILSIGRKGCLRLTAEIDQIEIGAQEGMKDIVDSVLMASYGSVGQQINAGNYEYTLIKDKSAHVLPIPLIRKDAIEV